MCSLDQELLRATERWFIDERILPFHAQWEKDGLVPRQLWRDAGAAALLLPSAPLEYGGGGQLPCRAWRSTRIGTAAPGRAGQHLYLYDQPPLGEISIGMRVRVVFEDVDAQVTLVQFEADRGAAA